MSGFQFVHMECGDLVDLPEVTIRNQQECLFLLQDCNAKFWRVNTFQLPNYPNVGIHENPKVSQNQGTQIYLLRNPSVTETKQLG